MIVDELIAILGYDVQGEGELRRFNDGLTQAERKAHAVANRINAMSVAIGTFVGQMAVDLARGVARTIGSLPGDIIRTSAQFEGFETALTTIEGTSEKARQSMDWIQDFARRTPYDLAGVTDAFIKLRSYGLEATDGTLRTLGDTASAMNKPLNQAVEMFADASSMEFERLKEFGLRAKQEGDSVTFLWTKNGKELTKTVKKQGDEVRRFILENLGDRFNGAMLRQSKTWNGLVANLGDAWEDFKLRIGRGGFFDSVKNRLSGFLDYIGRLDENGTLDRWSQSLSNGFERAVNAIESAVDRLYKVGKSIAGLFGSDNALWGLAAFAGALALRAFPLAAGITLVVAALDELWGFFEGKETRIGKWLADFPELEKALRSLGEGVEWLAEVLDPLAGYIVPVLGAAGAISLLAPAIRALASAMAMLTGLKLAWGLLAWLAALVGIGKGAAGVAALATAVEATGKASVDQGGKNAKPGGGRGIFALLGRLTPWVAALLTSGSTANNSYRDADAETRARMREDARTDAEAYNLGKGRSGPRNPRRGHFRGEVDRERSLDAFLDGPARQPVVPSPFDGGAIVKAVQGLAGRIAEAVESVTSSIPIAGQAAATNAGGGQFETMLQNFSAHVDGMKDSAMAGKVAAQITDQRQDNRDQSNHVEVNVGGVHVQQATQAPAAAGKAVGDAVSRGAMNAVRSNSVTSTQGVAP